MCAKGTIYFLLACSGINKQSDQDVQLQRYYDREREWEWSSLLL